MSTGGTDYPVTITLKAVNETGGVVDKLVEKLAGAGKKHGEHSDLAETLANATSGKGLAKLLGVSAQVEIGAHLFEAGEKLVEFGKEAFEFVKQLVESTVEAGAALGALARRTGLSANALVQWQYAAKQSHISSEDFTSAIDQFNKRMGEAQTGTGAFYKFLKTHAPDLAKQVKGVHSNEEALDLLSKAFEKVQDPQRRAALQAAAFGKGARDMGVFLGQGVDKLRELREEGAKLTGDQTEFVKNSEEAEEAINRISTAFDAMKNQTISALLPALEPVFTELTKLLVDNREDLKAWAVETRSAIQAWFEGGGIDRVHSKLSTFVDDFKQVYHWAKLAYDSVQLFNPANLLRGPGKFNDTLNDLRNDLNTVASPISQAQQDAIIRASGGSTNAITSAPPVLSRPSGVTASTGAQAMQNYGLTVNFQNAPKGMRVSGNAGPAVDYSVGYNMGVQ